MQFVSCLFRNMRNPPKSAQSVSWTFWVLLWYFQWWFKILENPLVCLEIEITTNWAFLWILFQCTNEVGADWETMQKCATTNEGSELLKMHGEDTHNLNPSVTFIPTILLNNSQRIQKDILKDLKKEVCSEYTLSTVSHDAILFLDG